MGPFVDAADVGAGHAGDRIQVRFVPVVVTVLGGRVVFDASSFRLDAVLLAATLGEVGVGFCVRVGGVIGSRRMQCPLPGVGSLALRGVRSP
ncbi:hypothetical protein [Mycobacterium sp. 4D054]|uniref:hypothetical protein n=1 Tax=Mycobacterium sp. 4D054 TaxID=3457440 RepID=UPI003FD128FC